MKDESVLLLVKLLMKDKIKVQRKLPFASPEDRVAAVALHPAPKSPVLDVSQGEQENGPPTSKKRSPLKLVLRFQ